MISTEGAQERLLNPSHPMYTVAQGIPLGRLGTPEGIVNVAVFLASDETTHIIGANFVVDGGGSVVLPAGQPERDD